MKLQIRTLGAEEIARNLRKYGDAGDKLLEKGMLEAAKIIQEEAKRQAPIGKGRVHYQLYKKLGYAPLNKVRRTGYLKKSIVVQKIETKELSNASATFHVGPSRGAFYGYFLEFGTKYGRQHPFLGIAFDYAQDRALQAIADTVRQGMEKL
jgi:HK97 gp10 family phage protein